MFLVVNQNKQRIFALKLHAERVAVLRYAGLPNPRAVAAKAEELLKILRDNKIKPAGDPLSWFYDPPWTLPFLRRNEAVVSLG